jgi:ABC-type nitrate/sulfonate/bicarbonate transport system substrate-binding protein
MRKNRTIFIGASALVSAFAVTILHSAYAVETVHAGKAVAAGYVFTPLEIGEKEGIYAMYGLNVTSSALTGDAKLQQALVAGSIDFGLGSGPGMAFAVKGAPVRAVAAYFGAPVDIAVTVKYDSPIKNVADLKGKLMSVSTVGSLTAWLTQRMSIHEGWGQNGIRIVATGGGPAMVSAIVTGAVDAGMGSYETALTLEEKHQLRPLVTMDQFVPRFITHVIFARQELVDHHPAEVESFVKGFFATLDWMRNHREQTIADADAVVHDGPKVMAATYDAETPLFSKTGEFDPVALKTIKESWLALHVLGALPKDDQFLTRRFVPVKLSR